MERRIVVITGANSGIGKAAAVKFASEGCQVIMACRNIDAGEIAMEKIRKASGSPYVKLMKLDVSSFESIAHFQAEFVRHYERLDVLIHNAAYFNHGAKVYQLSPDGIETTFATNTFGPLYLTRLLLPSLAKSEDPRILNACTTNIKHFYDPKRRIDFDDLRGEFRGRRRYNVYRKYGDSKMALLMLTFKMAEMYKDPGIKVNAVMIPAIRQERSSLKKFRGIWRFIAAVRNPFTPPPERIASTYFHICTSGEFGTITGKLINHFNRVVLPSRLGARPDLITNVKELFGSDYYPGYADRADVREKVWEIGGSLTPDPEAPPEALTSDR